ncbi:MAG TPA: hypothetical protein VLW85_08505 [Myxococcales bacterium]|nr:hypothetical protein [Myxococcales bacterium]
MNAPLELPLGGDDRRRLVRALLDAQLQWEHYHASRLRLVHALALGGLCFWIFVAVETPLNDGLRVMTLCAWLWCLLATGWAGGMELLWSRRRLRQIDELRR